MLRNWIRPKASISCLVMRVCVDVSVSHFCLKEEGLFLWGGGGGLFDKEILMTFTAALSLSVLEHLESVANGNTSGCSAVAP
ncbi:hypothetical protein JZ751_009320 [Albula glossodonta]|uniref:Uncharacterized protein n=1 Tax=Albula glossodonta TaxID=121402 RepID=A0A8T2N1M3_9TELE|nr:hypothetical protein JZ751_009320 [Albula glossodonta]